MKIKIEDVIELKEENRIKITYKALDDLGNEISYLLTMKFDPNNNETIDTIKEQIYEVARRFDKIKNKISQLKNLKGQTIDVPAVI